MSELMPIVPAELLELLADSCNSPRTRENYTAEWSAFVSWVQGHGGLLLNRDTVLAYRAHLLDSGKSPGCVNLALSAIKKIVTEATTRGLLSVGDMTAIVSIKGVPKRGVRVRRWLDDQQVQALFDAVPRSGKYPITVIRNRALLAALYATAIRKHEFHGLRVEQFMQIGQRWALADIKGKGPRIRTVVLPDWAARAIQNWLEASGIKEGPLFRSVDGAGNLKDEMTYRGVAEVVLNLGRVAGLGRLAPHDLRRSAADEMRRNGAPMDRISETLGHANEKVTRMYLRQARMLENPATDALKER